MKVKLKLKDYNDICLMLETITSERGKELLQAFRQSKLAKDKLDIQDLNKE